eukprot:1765163-Amphidinium_carterae.1
MSLESLDILRQQGFPLSSTEFGLHANIGVEAHGCGNEEGYDRCVQGGISNISNIQNVGMDAYLNDPGMVEPSKPGGDDQRGIPNPIIGRDATGEIPP